jgi:hypothetical protein
MSRRAALAAAALAAAVTAGCGSAAPRTGAGLSLPPPSLATSLVTATGAWAVVEMGGSVASHNNFWQLFVRPAGASAWRLATPPGVASNGGLVMASVGAGTVVAGFRPSQDLASSPLATTHDNGATWSPSILAAGLADVPGALAAAPGTGRLLALLTGGTIEMSGPGGTGWRPLASRRAIAGSAAAAGCGLRGLTAAAFGPSGVPMVAGGCARPGAAGIFGYAHGAWHAAGPALPPAYRHDAVTVLRLTTAAGAGPAGISAAGGTAALLAAGSGTGTRVLAAWSVGGRWALSRPLSVGGATITAASFGPGGAAAIRVAGNRGEVIAGPAAPWRPLPALPPGTATLAPGPAGGWDALAVHRATLTVWRLAPAARAWAATQAIHVPIQYGSSS